MPVSKVAHTRMALAVLVALTSGTPALAQSVPADAAENSRLWFVELTGKTVADGNTQTSVRAEQSKFLAAAQAAGVQFVQRRNFETLFNGFSVEVSPDQRLKLAKVTGVRALYPVEVIQAPQPVVEPSSPDLVAALNLSGAATAQNVLGLTGAGVKVGIIDSGIEVDHPAFGGTGALGTTPFPNARIYAGYDFVGDAFDGSNAPVPDGDPRDCAATGANASGGHGTHVAGIVGANGGGIKGVAPGAQLAAYRVFGCFGSTTADIMIAAMERALLDGVNVINMSIGSRAQWPQYPTAQAASRLAKKGVVMANSIGNNGPGGSAPDALFAAGAPGLGEHVIGTASFDNAQRAFTVAGTPYGFNQATGSPTAPSSGSSPMSRTGDTTVANDGCNALPAGSLAGTVVLIRRGTCGFYNKAFNAQNAGAAGVVLYNNAAGAINPTVAPPTGADPPITIPVVAITAAQGATLNGLIAAGPTQLTWTGNYVGFPFGTGGLISGFSSFGLGADLSFKPDIGAPGGGIVSTYPLLLGGSATLSGTSMSSPHIAGAAALILQAVPTAALGNSSPVVGRTAPPPINMITRMMNTAKPKNWSGNPGLGFLDHSFRQGAGMVDIVAAIQSQQFVVPNKFSTGESQAGPKVQKLTIRNDAATPVTYTMGHVSGVQAGPNAAGATAWTLSGVFDAPATVSFSANPVVVPAKGTATVTATVTANAALPDRSLYGGYITLTPQGAGMPLQVPYGGLKGDYQTTEVLRAGANGFPWLATLTGTTFSKCPAGGCSYTMAGGNVPWVLFQLAHQAQRLTVEVFDSTGTQSRGLISDDTFLGRNTTPSGFFSFSWNGDTSMGTQPNGTYLIRIAALKPLGDPANPAHLDVRTLPPVTLARP
ncbi:S8 family serine peptidase [Aquabacterium humicola]|uniref:S8 family serine peptidase n=1 Tax=Aquabacterium humicola TaxID=3237377 RepID=UPI002543187C|nr:S8 family serine peptidase [Rubrivivax pictus]